MHLLWNVLLMMCFPVFCFADDAGGAEGAAGEGDSNSEADTSSDAGSAEGSDNDGADDGGTDESGESGESDASNNDASTPDYTNHENYLAFARKNGAFENADEYNIPTSFEGVEIPESLASQWDVSSDAKLFAGMAAKYGLTQSQAEGVFKDYVTNALEITKAAEQEGLESQKPEVILKEVYGEGNAQEALPFLERGLKALGVDPSKGLRIHHGMKAITELGRLTSEDGNFHNAGAGGGNDGPISAEEWIRQA